VITIQITKVAILASYIIDSRSKLLIPNDIAEQQKTNPPQSQEATLFSEHNSGSRQDNTFLVCTAFVDPLYCCIAAYVQAVAVALFCCAAVLLFRCALCCCAAGIAADVAFCLLHASCRMCAP
jgi:hypothetical protein